MKKKCLISSIIVTMFLLISFNVKAESLENFLDETNEGEYSKQIYTESNTSDVLDMNEVNEETYARIALDFSKGFYPEKEFHVSEMVPIFDSGAILIGYSCQIKENENDHGYVIIDNRLKGDYISEFNLNKGIKNIFSNIVETASEKVETIADMEAEDIPEEKRVMITTEEMVYNVNINDIVVNTSGDISDEETFLEVIESDNYNNSPYDHSGDILNDYPLDYTFVDFYSVGQFFSLTQSQPENAVGKFACSVSAMTIIADKIGLAGGATDANYPNVLKTTYEKLWTASYTTVSDTAIKNGKTITYGGTQDRYLPGAMKSLAASKGLSVNSLQTYSPTIAQMKSTLKANRNFVFGYNATGGASGHSVAAQAFYTGKKGSSTHDFLGVADGWTMGSRWLNFTANQKYLTNTCMTAFW